MSAYRAVVVGDLSTGKTSLISTLLTGKFPGQLGSGPSSLENLGDTSMSVSVDGKERALTLVDTETGISGGRMDRDYYTIPKTFVHADAFLVTYSVDRPWSLSNATNKWLPMIRNHLKKTNGKNAPVFLVGLKADLRDQAVSEGARPWVTVEQAETAANTMHADCHYDVSSSTANGLTELIETLVREVDTARNDEHPAAPHLTAAKEEEDEESTKHGSTKHGSSVKKGPITRSRANGDGFVAKITSFF